MHNILISLIKTLKEEMTVLHEYVIFNTFYCQKKIIEILPDNNLIS
jgi:hypothetical protein